MKNSDLASLLVIEGIQQNGTGVNYVDVPIPSREGYKALITIVQANNQGLPMITVSQTTNSGQTARFYLSGNLDTSHYLTLRTIFIKSI